MVNYQQLSTADPVLWSDAAKDWSALGLRLGGAAKNLSTQTHQPLAAGGWSGQAADTALGRIRMACTVLEAAEGEVSAVAAVLNGLAEATTIARGMLDNASALAAKANLFISPDGTVNPLIPSPGREHNAHSTCQQLIDEALRRASAADALAAAQLAKLATRTRVANVRQVYDQDVGDATRTELATITTAIPTGPPGLVSTWWSSLSRAEQERLKLAVPATLAGLDGIPDSVKGELHGSDGIDRVKLIKYALENWKNTGDRKFGDDCTNFASDALAAAGLTQVGSWPSDRTDVKHNWYTSPTGEGIDKVLDLAGAAPPRSYSWTEAPGLHQFLVNNNSYEIPVAESKPGDIIFWQNPKEGIHHAAIVTSVVDGHVFYTAHSGSQQNGDWNLRQTMYNQEGSPENPVVVRPRQTGMILAGP